MSDINKDRKSAVREAWKKERALVREGRGTRDWSQSEQREIVAKGRVSGYEGHHMKSVKEYPQYAVDSNNIQFLTRVEHVNGAHNGNTQNATNGYYDPQTGTMSDFGENKPQAPTPQKLSVPLQRETGMKERIEMAKAEANRRNKSLDISQTKDRTKTQFER